MFFFSKFKKSDPVSSFWKWFEHNEGTLFNIDISEDNETLLSLLEKHLKLIDQNLTFEISNVQNGKREFIISANGIKSSFESVERIYDTAPVLSRWTWVKFRPRSNNLMDIDFGTIKVKVKTVYYLINKVDDSKLSITLYFKGYDINKADLFGQAGFLMLDQALGEYNVATKLSSVEFLPLEGNESDYSSITKLSTEFDQLLNIN